MQENPQSDKCSSILGSTSKDRTILHISDLHFGFHFNESKWLDLKNTALEAKPDLVVITGDLVNTPWRWVLDRVKSELSQFATELSDVKDSIVHIRVIPGNHDTRISGLFPITWLTWFALVMVILFTWLRSETTGLPPWLSWGCLVFTVVALVFRGLMTTNLKKALGKEFFLCSVEVFPKLRIGIVPFDSASPLRAWAQGHVTPSNIVDCKRGIKDNNGVKPVWIAAVHHHPLPLPYDHTNETMMVMDNAGAFLSEVARMGIKLVLHGHKHHQHFARISVDPATRQTLDVAVLSAGTPTEGTNPGTYQHGFNIIRVDRDDCITIEMFEAAPNGGTFVFKRQVDLAPLETQAQQRFEEFKSELGVWCRRMICIADINDFGDASFRREFYGVQTSKDNLKELSDFQGEVNYGIVEAFRVWTLSNHGPGVMIGNRQQPALNKISVRVDFKGHGLQKDHLPIDFVTEFEAHNAFALNLWQLKSMCLSTKSVNNRNDELLEKVNFWVTNQLAVEELVLVIKYPAAICLPKRMELSWSRMGSERNVVSMSSHSIVRMETQNMIHVRISHPKSGAIYEINWDVDDEDDNPAGHHAISIRSWLWENRNIALNELNTLILVAEESIRQELSGQIVEPLNVALFIYDQSDGLLICLTGNYEPNDERHDWKFSFGCGLPGRVFKSARVAAFTKPPDIGVERALGYIRGDGKLIDTASDVPEEAILAFPLAPPRAPDWPYAVLQISTDNPMIKLKTSDTAVDRSIEMVRQALMEAMTKELEVIMSQNY